MISVQSGERELRIPFTALPLLVIESENKNAGAPLPKKPVAKTTQYFWRGIVLSARIARGSETKNEMLIRRQASSIAEKPTSDFLIRMYEVPHIKVSSASKIQFCGL